VEKAEHPFAAAGGCHPAWQDVPGHTFERIALAGGQGYHISGHAKTAVGNLLSALFNHANV